MTVFTLRYITSHQPKDENKNNNFQFFFKIFKI